LIAAKLAHLNDDVKTGLSYCPITIVLGFCLEERKHPGIKLPIDKLSNYRQLHNCLFSDLKADVFTERKNLKSNKLFTEVFSEAFAHATKELHCDDAIVLAVVMGHLNHMLQDIVSSIFVVEMMGKDAEFLSSLCLCLNRATNTCN